MKKLLILMLVLGMASAANATTLSWSEDAITIGSPGSTAVVYLVSDDSIGFTASKWVGYTPATPSLGTIANITALPPAGGNPEIQDPAASGWPGWWTVISKDTETPFTVASGSQYSVTIQGLNVGTFGLDSDDYGQNDILEVTVLPEPITVTLLGLGSLFLLRRRKS